MHFFLINSGLDVHHVKMNMFLVREFDKHIQENSSVLQ